jgi:hypothetical protein
MPSHGTPSTKTPSTRTPEKQTRRYVKKAKHFWLIVKKRVSLFFTLFHFFSSLSLLWRSVFHPSRFLFSKAKPSRFNLASPTLSPDSE